MIDLHNHVLYSLDDGAPDKSYAVRMLQAAKKIGVEGVACTPHFFHPDFTLPPLKLVQERFEVLRGEGVLPLFLAAEHYFGNSFIETLEKNRPELLCVNGQPYLLLELGSQLKTQFLDKVVFRLRDKGIRVVIAHPERNDAFSADTERLDYLREVGCLYQINAKSLTGRQGASRKKNARRLIDKGLAHLVASDAHTVEDYSTHFHDAAQWAEKRLGNDIFELLFIINPWLILNGRKPIQMEDSDQTSAALARVRRGAK